MRIGILAAALILAAAPAVANENNPFAGAYIGAHAGYSFLDNEANFDGWNLGAQAGYMLALGNGFNAGLETDVALSTANIKGTDGEIAFKYSQDWMASIRAKLGYQITTNIQPFVTGGIAWGKFKESATDGESSESVSDIMQLWVLGGGVDYHIPATNIIASAGVYQYFDTSISDGLTQFRLGANLKLN
ncbi:MAG: outer membrane protein [Betaproteobacteria bacterium]